MTEPFKTFFNDALIKHTGVHLKRVWPAFDQRRFVHEAGAGLDALEMKARAMQIASALEATLPQDFERAAGLLEAALAPAPLHDAPNGERNPADGLAGWVVWSLGEFVVRRGMHEPERALQALHAMTQRFSAEFAIRPFIATHPALCFETLARWTRDESAYVRRSVAKHLNDIAKDHPAVVADWLTSHLPGAGKERTALLRHASRTLIKSGDARVGASRSRWT